jgi:hypothetical protein
MHTYRNASILMTVLLASPLAAQLNRGSLTGLVTDPTQGVIAEAKIVAENIETRQQLFDHVDGQR